MCRSSLGFLASPISTFVCYIDTYSALAGQGDSFNVIIRHRNFNEMDLGKAYEAEQIISGTNLNDF